MWSYPWQISRTCLLCYSLSAVTDTSKTLSSRLWVALAIPRRTRSTSGGVLLELTFVFPLAANRLLATALIWFAHSLIAKAHYYPSVSSTTASFSLISVAFNGGLPPVVSVAKVLDETVHSQIFPYPEGILGSGVKVVKGHISLMRKFSFLLFIRKEYLSTPAITCYCRRNNWRGTSR